MRNVVRIPRENEQRACTANPECCYDRYDYEAVMPWAVKYSKKQGAKNGLD